MKNAAVAAATEAFHEALRTNDAEAMFAYVADDAVMMPPGEAALRGKSAMSEWYAGFLSGYRTSALTLSDREVIVDGDLAVEIGVYAWELTPVSGGEPVLDRGNYLQVWRCQRDGRWRFTREIWNSSLPQAP